MEGITANGETQAIPDSEVFCTILDGERNRYGVLTHADVGYLAEDFGNWSRLNALANEQPSPDGSPFSERMRAAIDLDYSYQWYEAVDGTTYPLDLSQVADADELQRNPVKVLEEQIVFDEPPGRARDFFGCKATGNRGVYLYYDAFERPADREEAGKSHAEGFGLVVWVGWPETEPPPKHGITSRQYFAQQRGSDRGSGGPTQSADELAELAARGEFPKGKPEDTICNWFVADAIPSDGEPAKEPMLQLDILKSLNRRFSDWPRLAGEVLFVPKGRNDIHPLLSCEALFSWYGDRGPVHWMRGARFVPRLDFYHAVKRHARHYAAVEHLPHEPPYPDRYYACEMPEPGDGKTLEQLLDQFCPATLVDRELIKAMLLMIVWGGDPGTRPAFLITADDGRGTGKSKLAQLVGQLAGGTVELSSNEDGALIRQRLLSPEAMKRRVVVLDNVKSHRFSWGELESLITCDTISGKRLYVGEASRPNSLIWIITLNGASLSTDLAQRCVVIHLDKPKRSAGWEEQTRALIRDKRQEIVGDLIGLLRGPKAKLRKFSRWASWEAEVLACVEQPEDCQRIILERQAVTDVEREEADVVMCSIEEQLEGLHYDINVDRVFIPSSVAADWFNAATKERCSVVAVSRKLNQLIKEGSVTSITRDVGRNRARGFIWWPKEADPAGTVLTDLETRIENLSGRLKFD